ncbi:hypothetical protein [Tautonia rosea]|uniref:hypothetical protein n=1 Tax=Tautonia rosea TaxID=2728037 RepID=UPI001473C8C2|nr:hypothetical protein [Tautonia rosea]
MLAGLTIALGLTVFGGHPIVGQTLSPPPIPAHPVHGMRVPAHGPGAPAVPHEGDGHGHGLGHHHAHGGSGGFILPNPGPGDGWGFPNDSPDGYGWYDPGITLPIREDRTTAYYFRRYMAVPPETMFLPNYYNPFVTRGQRYLPYSGLGGMHAAGGAPSGSAATPVTPYSDLTREVPSADIPTFSGEVQAPPINSSRIDSMIDN